MSNCGKCPEKKPKTGYHIRFKYFTRKKCEKKLSNSQTVASVALMVWCVASKLGRRFSYIKTSLQRPAHSTTPWKVEKNETTLWFTTPHDHLFTKIIISCQYTYENTSTNSRICSSSQPIILISSWPLAESWGSRKTLLVRFTGTIDS